MFLLILIIVVSSKYKVFYQDGQPWMNFSNNLTAQLRLDKQLSQFLNRESPCSLQEAKQCYETYQDESGRKRNFWLQREEFQNNETITYKNRSIDPTDLLQNINYLALGPKQLYKNTFYENGFMLCLSSSDGFLQTNYNQHLTSERSVLQMVGIVGSMKEKYVMQIKFIEFSNQIFDISKNSIQITQDNYISLPPLVFRAFFLDSEIQQFTYNVPQNAFIRDSRENSNQKLPLLLLYNPDNIDRPLIVENYIDFNYNNWGYDVLRIQQSDKIVLGMPFLRNKQIYVQTAQNFLFVQQFYTEKCISDVSTPTNSETTWITIQSIIFILGTLFVLAIFLIIKLCQKIRRPRQNIGIELQNFQNTQNLFPNTCRSNYSNQKSFLSKDSLKPLLH